MNKIDNLELRGICAENASMMMTSYSSGSGNGSGGSGNGSGGNVPSQYNVLLKSTTFYTSYNYDFYEIECPAEARFLKVAFSQLPGNTSCPSITVTNYSGKQQTTNCEGTVLIPLTGRDAKLFRVNISDRNASLKMDVSVYTCSCAL